MYARMHDKPCFWDVINVDTRLGDLRGITAIIINIITLQHTLALIARQTFLIAEEATKSSNAVDTYLFIASALRITLDVFHPA